MQWFRALLYQKSLDGTMRLAVIECERFIAELMPYGSGDDVYAL
jgi:hypothetical protein